MTGEIETTRVEKHDRLTVQAHQQKEFQSFNGGTHEAPCEVARLKIPADQDLARQLGEELMAFAAEKSDAEPPGDGKPIHQQMDEAYNR